MSLAELEIIEAFIERATCPEDVFGRPSGAPTAIESGIKRAYHKLAKALHPDAHNGGPKAELELAGALFRKLEIFHNEAVERVRAGTYGDKKPVPGKAPIIINGKYVSERGYRAGDIADLYVASVESSTKRSNLLLKVARTTDDNDLLRAEADTLEALHKRLPKDTWGDCIPNVLDTMLLDDRGKRRVNVMNRFTGFYDGEEIRKRMPDGVDGRTVVWMWKRLLVLLEWTWKTGYIHGAVLPPHVMFYPDNDGGKVRDIRKHSIRLVDWAYSVQHAKRTRLSAWVPKYERLYAPEVKFKKALGPWTDLFMGARTILYLAGDDSGGIKGCPNLPKEIYQAIAVCAMPDPTRRPQSIGKYFEKFMDVARTEYGAPRWHEFVLPGI